MPCGSKPVQVKKMSAQALRIQRNLDGEESIKAVR
jgi:hypothetical protein